MGSWQDDTAFLLGFARVSAGLDHPRSEPDTNANTVVVAGSALTPCPNTVDCQALPLTFVLTRSDKRLSIEPLLELSDETAHSRHSLRVHRSRSHLCFVSRAAGWLAQRRDREISDGESSSQLGK